MSSNCRKMRNRQQHRFSNKSSDAIFVHKIKWPHAQIKSGDIRFADEWHGAWITDAVVHREWIAKPYPLPELFRMHPETPHHFCDALARSVAALKKEDALIEKLKTFLQSFPIAAEDDPASLFFV